MESSFPPALVDRVNAMNVPGIKAEAVKIDKVVQGEANGYDVIIDRIKGTGVPQDAGKAKQEVQKEEDLAQQDKGNPELYLIKGKRLLYEENLPGAIAEIKKAISMNSQRAHYHVELAKVLMRKDDGANEAEAALVEALKLVPDSPKLMTLLAQAIYKQKRVDEALGMYEKAVRDPKAKNGEARFALGIIYRNDKKDLAKAADYFTRAGQDFIGDTMMVASSYDELGLTLEAKGDKVGARKAYEDSLNAEKEFEKVYCDFAKFLSKNGTTADDKDLVKKTAAEYLKMTPRGECAADMTALAK